MENSIEEDIKILEEFKTHGYAMLLMKYEDRNKTNLKIDQAIEHILSDYKRVLKENEKKDKIIDLMANNIATSDSDLCEYLDITVKCKYYAGDNGKTCDNCIKQYFENKAKEV